MRCAPSPTLTTRPRRRTTRMVKHSEYDSASMVRNIKDKIRKARHYGAPNAAIDSGACFRMFTHSFEARVQRGQKFSAEARTLRLIPFERGPDIMFDPRSKDELPGHEPRRMRAKTSSRVAPAFGSASNSARRRSSSARCHSVSGSASGTAETLSQIASTRRTLSWTGRARISATSSRFIKLGYTMCLVHAIVHG